MPRFSIIVPAYQVQGFLRECLDSVLGQSYPDFEVIAVDDRSPDGCGAIIDEYAARDDRVTAVHLPRNVGLGRARNAGLPYARGDYLLFLDSDDSYTPGTLEALARRIEAADDPDVLIFDYARTHWWGGFRRNIMHGVFAAAGDAVFTAAERPEFLDLIMVVWNKAYRRDFTERHGFAFPPGYYEDTPWTFPVLLSAGRIAVLDRVCLLYRQRRQGNILRTTSRKHFDILDQYERVFTFLDEHPELADWRPYLHRRMAGHCLEILDKSNRLPERDKPEFYRLAARACRRHRPAGHTLPVSSQRTALRLLSGAPYWLFAAHRGCRAALTRLRAHGTKLRGRALQRAKRLVHRLLSLRPLDPHLAVYSASHHRGVLGDPAAIHHRARQLAPHIRSVWVVRPDAVAGLPPGIDHVTPDSLRYWATVARATYFVNNVNWAHELVKRPGSVHVQTHQGTPLKHMGVDLLGHPAATHRTNVRAMLRRCDRWDYSLAANAHSERIWDRAYPCHFTSLPTGSPRNDVLFTADPAHAARVRRRLGIPQGDTVVLYAPTQRDHHATGYVRRVDLAAFTRALGPGHTLLVRLHPTLDRHPVRGTELADLARQGLLIDVTDEPSVEDLMLASDALVTDYSSLMFDYAHLDRPIVLHADDWETYRANRGVYFDVLAEPPGHVCTDTGRLAALFRSGAYADERAARLRAAFRERFRGYDDGHAAARVVGRLMLGERPATTIPAQEQGPAAEPVAGLVEGGRA
ncbi:bifunctional glycosyltransferase family 2 protein/CDP-glycerol:glycerophosphate glycerophosphotransferase [Streptomyces sp. NPDC047123]|uniref:bifunctional glycosyltransferase/CDP-glycerol:glycerophosphate glycerophosphotransferase n=1 Tax=Streptomyces sp. NPDC047123 TaxID=3155622 RepID=UPI0033D3AB63